MSCLIGNLVQKHIKIILLTKKTLIDQQKNDTIKKYSSHKSGLVKILHLLRTKTIKTQEAIFNFCAINMINLIILLRF